MMMMMMIAITVSILLGNVQSFDGGSLCEELIIPSGYPCSEYTIQTKDGFLLGLQRVSSSSSLRLRNHGDRGPPVLLLHGLFMVTSSFYSSHSSQCNKCVNYTTIYCFFVFNWTRSVSYFNSIGFDLWISPSIISFHCNWWLGSLQMLL